MTLEQKIRALIQEFRAAYYGEDVREKYAEIAELVLIEALKQMDGAVEKGNYAEQQGNYAKKQGDYAKQQGALTEEQTNKAIAEIRLTMQQIEDEFGDIKDIINSTENGELLLRIEALINDLYKMATDTDIDRIIAGTYVDEDEEGSIFEAASNQDIDDIIGGTYTEVEEPGNDTTEVNMTNIIDNAFKEV